MDPFSNDPFQHMEQQMRNMQRMMKYTFGGTGMGSMFNDPFFNGPLVRQQQLTQPRLEEVDEGEDTDQGQYSRVDGEPIVEEPDDPQENGNYWSNTDRGQTRNNTLGHVQPQRSGGGLFDMMMNPQMGQGNSYQSYSYSSYSSSGPGGVQYQETQQTNMGPGGVLERKRSVRDSRAGKEQIEVTRGLQGRGRTVQRTRYQDGRQESLDTLHNLQPDETNHFEDQWQQASRAMGGSRMNSSNNQRFRQIGDGSDTSSFRRRM